MPRYKAVKVNGKKVDEHIAVWEAANGPRPKGYVVHHIDGDHLNNALDNLQLMTHWQHAKHHMGGTERPERRISTVRHGTATGYGKHGCRCEECTAYNRNKSRRLRGLPLDQGWGERMAHNKKHNYNKAMQEIRDREKPV